MTSGEHPLALVQIPICDSLYCSFKGIMARETDEYSRCRSLDHGDSQVGYARGNDAIETIIRNLSPELLQIDSHVTPFPNKTGDCHQEFRMYPILVLNDVVALQWHIIQTWPIDCFFVCFRLPFLPRLSFFPLLHGFPRRRL